VATNPQRRQGVVRRRGEGAVRAAIGAGSRVKQGLVSRVIRNVGRFSGYIYVPLDYPPSAANVPRYGYGKPPHPQLKQLFDKREPAVLGALATLQGYIDDLRSIEVHVGNPREPSWVNGWIPGLDGAAIYSFLRERRPSLYLEIGSGNSTLFAARARRDGDLPTTIVSIDPRPRVDIDTICDEIYRTPLEGADLTLFDRLGAGDVLFFDGSHRIFMNSDVATFFLDVLPRVAPGVLVAIHDIFLPDDYALDVAPLFYSEQYALATYLLAPGVDVEILLPAMYVSRAPQYRDVLDDFWDRVGHADVERGGSLFWFLSP
jgi:hypothetical protein